jgi:hypothetical protein
MAFAKKSVASSTEGGMLATPIEEGRIIRPIRLMRGANSQGLAFCPETPLGV